MAGESRQLNPHDPSKWIDTLVFYHQKKFDIPHIVTKQARFGHRLLSTLESIMATLKSIIFMFGRNGMALVDLTKLLRAF